MTAPRHASAISQANAATPIRLLWIVKNAKNRVASKRFAFASVDGLGDDRGDHEHDRRRRGRPSGPGVAPSADGSRGASRVNAWAGVEPGRPGPILVIRPSGGRWSSTCPVRRSAEEQVTVADLVCTSRRSRSAALHRPPARRRTLAWRASVNVVRPSRALDPAVVPTSTRETRRATFVSYERTPLRRRGDGAGALRCPRRRAPRSPASSRARLAVTRARSRAVPPATRSPDGRLRSVSVRAIPQSAVASRPSHARAEVAAPSRPITGSTSASDVDGLPELGPRSDRGPECVVPDSPSVGAPIGSVASTA